MKNQKKNLGFIFVTLLFVLLLGILIWYFLRGSYESSDFSDLKSWITTGKIRDIEIESVSWKLGVSVSNAKRLLGIFHLHDGSRYQFEIFLDDHGSKSFYDLIAEQGIKDLFKKPPKVYDSSLVSGWTEVIRLLPLLIGMALTFFIFFRMFKSSGGGGVNPFGMGKNRARQTESKVKFSDVAGISEEKQELVELVDYLKNSVRYAQMGARTPKGVLLEGPPGTGKTLLAKAVAGEAGVPFFSISGSEFEEMFVGVGASRVRDLFNNAKKNSPCIIFIDEIDAVGRKRNTSLGSGTNEQTLNQLLVEMDGFETNAGVIIIAATNRVEILDLALLRPGRFDRTIQLSLPDIREREAILRLHARNKNISGKVSFKRIAERTPGFSGAQLENVLNEATLLAVRKRQNVIDLEDIDEAIDRVVGGPAKRSRTMNEYDKKVVSYHEAGHALIGLKLKHASKVQKVTIIPRGNAGGYTIMTPKEESFLQSRENLLATIAGFLGGRASEEIIFGAQNITTGAHDDFEKASYISRRMVTQWGMSKLGIRQYESPKDEYPSMGAKFSNDTSNKIDAEIEKILQESYEKAKSLIKEHSQLLEILAESLRIQETITAEDIEYIEKHQELPPRIQETKRISEELKQKELNGDIIEAKPKSKNTDVSENNSEDKKDDKTKK